MCALFSSPFFSLAAQASFHLGRPRGPRLPSSLVFTRSHWAVEGSLRSLIRRLFRPQRQNRLRLVRFRKLRRHEKRLGS